jgi:ribose transport system permease protein
MESTLQADQIEATSPPRQPRRRLSLDAVAGRLVLLLLLVGAAIVSQPAFGTMENLRTVLLAVSTVGVMAVGMTLVLLAGEIDLSVGGVAVVSGVVGGMLLSTGSIVLIVAGVLLTGVLCGLANGLLVTRLRVPSLIVTLGMLGILRALANILSGGQAIYPEAVDAYVWFGRGALLGIPMPVLVFLATAVAAAILARHSRFGRALYAVGGNAAAAALSGIRVDKVRLLVFVASGAAAALAGLLETARLAYIGPAGFTGIELTVIAVITLGGVSLAGGRGTVEGTILAALILGVVNNVLNIAGVSSYVQQIVTAAVILLVVLPDGLQRRERGV